MENPYLSMLWNALSQIAPLLFGLLVFVIALKVLEVKLFPKNLHLNWDGFNERLIACSEQAGSGSVHTQPAEVVLVACDPWTGLMTMLIENQRNKSWGEDHENL